MPVRLHSLAVLIVTAFALSACGEGEELVQEPALRECLAEGGLQVEAPDLASGAALGNVSPDFRIVADDGTEADLVVQGTEEKARRSAANIRGALASFGAAGSEVINARNAIVVYERPPSDASRETIDGCLER